MMKYATGLFAAGILACSSAVWAAPAMTPKDIVAKLYEPYLIKDNANVPGSLEAILPIASKSLKKAIEREEACQKREQGICNLDSDIIVNGQDWELADLAIKEESKSRDRQTIRADFFNEVKNRVYYLFVKEKGAWKIGNVQAISYKEDGTVDTSWKLKETLLK